jgi:DinB superfamily
MFYGFKQHEFCKFATQNFNLMYISDIGALPPFFDKYILRNNPEMSLAEGLELNSPEKIINLQLEKLLKIGDKVYAPDKWTIKQIVQHCIDTERIMSFRALSFARGEKNEIFGFDENAYADNADVSLTTLEDLISEYSLLRKSTVDLFKNLKEKDLQKKGTASKIDISPLALGFVIVGHPMHHFNVIEERYFPLV